MRVHGFIDLTGTAVSDADFDAAVTGWRQPEQLEAIASSITVVTGASGPSRLPSDAGHWSVIPSAAPVDALNAALELAAANGAALLILSGLVEVGTEAFGVLRQQLERDPMFGFSIPRVCCANRCCVARLTRHGVGATEWIPRSVLGELPEAEILVETMSPCILVAPQVTGNFAVRSEVEALPTALLGYMAAARRCGFRTILCNRAVVSVGGLDCRTRSVTLVDPVTAPAPSAGPAIPDYDRSWDQFGARSAERFEALYAALPHSRASAPPSILMDIRNVAPVHNGTSHAILGLVRAFKELDTGWSVSLLASDEGRRFHGLERVFRGTPLYTQVPDRSFTAAFRPSQPWEIREMVDLHSVSIVNAYLLLDTIAWDVAYCAPAHLDGAWHFLAAHADGLLYDSEFTRQRFITRFPAGADVPGLVTRFSFDPADYAGDRGAAAPGPTGHILVVGNHLDHKDVRLTTRTLATAFPYRTIRVLGPTDVISPSVSAHSSGLLEGDQIHRLYAGADCIVYPSFYEGFGFPILTALAYGRTVLVRRSPLVEEMAPFWRGAGRVVMFDRREELAELVGRATSGESIEAVPCGDADGPPRRWRDVAVETHQFLTSLIEDRPVGRWAARDRVIRQLMAHRG